MKVLLFLHLPLDQGGAINAKKMHSPIYTAALRLNVYCLEGSVSPNRKTITKEHVLSLHEVLLP